MATVAEKLAESLEQLKQPYVQLHLPLGFAERQMQLNYVGGTLQMRVN